MNVFITRKIPGIAKERLTNRGFKVKVFTPDRAISKDELIRKAKNADAIITLVTDRIDKEIIDELKCCKIIANYGVGYNNIDFKYANSKGIRVTNTPGTLTDSTADLAMALILSCCRKIVESDNFTRDGKFVGWKPELFLGMELKNKTLGIIGAGAIGQATSIRAKAFGCKIIYFNRNRKEKYESDQNAKKVSLNVLLKKSDIISIHVPFTKETENLLNEQNMKNINPNAIIVNTARGGIIDEKILYKMLKQNKIFAAGFDVYENEPKFNTKFIDLKNVILLPHIGSATIEARGRMAKSAADNVIAVLKKNKPINPVI